jgi:hypothetical protein
LVAASLGRTGIEDIQTSELMQDGWEMWLEWQQTAHPDNSQELETIAADKGDHLDYVRTVERRREDAALVDYCWPDTMRSFPVDYHQLAIER